VTRQSKASFSARHPLLMHVQQMVDVFADLKGQMRNTFSQGGWLALRVAVHVRKKKNAESNEEDRDRGRGWERII
jgi:hypothetical protein